MPRLVLHLAARFAVWYLWNPSLGLARRRAGKLSRLAWVLWGRKNRQAVIANVKASLPPESFATGTSPEAIAQESFGLLLRNFADLGQTPRYLGKSLPVEEQILDPDPEALAKLFAEPTVWVTGHFAAWEAACGALARRVSVPCNFTARGFSDAWLTEQVSQKRRIGASKTEESTLEENTVEENNRALFVRTGRGGLAGALRGVLRHRQAAVFFSDQRQVGGTKVKLLGQEVWLADTAVRLALRAGVGLVCFRAVDQATGEATDKTTDKTEPHSIKLELGPILLPPRTGKPKPNPATEAEVQTEVQAEVQAEVQVLCQKLADWYSQEILRSPECWLWTRNRFRL